MDVTKLLHYVHKLKQYGGNLGEDAYIKESVLREWNGNALVEMVNLEEEYSRNDIPSINVSISQFNGKSYPDIIKGDKIKQASQLINDNSYRYYFVQYNIDNNNVKIYCMSRMERLLSEYVKAVDGVAYTSAPLPLDNFAFKYNDITYYKCKRDVFMNVVKYVTSKYMPSQPPLNNQDLPVQTYKNDRGTFIVTNEQASSDHKYKIMTSSVGNGAFDFGDHVIYTPYA